MVLGVGKGVLFREVSSQFRSVLIEREVPLYLTLWANPSITERLTSVVLNSAVLSSTVGSCSVSSPTLSPSHSTQPLSASAAPPCNTHHTPLTLLCTVCVFSVLDSNSINILYHCTRFKLHSYTLVALVRCPHFKCMQEKVSCRGVLISGGSL